MYPNLNLNRKYRGRFYPHFTSVLSSIIQLCMQCSFSFNSLTITTVTVSKLIFKPCRLPLRQLRHQCLSRWANGNITASRGALHTSQQLSTNWWDNRFNTPNEQNLEEEHQELKSPDKSSQDENRQRTIAMRIQKQYRDPAGITRRIHIYGLGAVGLFIAHSLRGIPNPPPVTLIHHKSVRYWQWKRQGLNSVTLSRKGRDVEHQGFDVDLSVPYPRYHKQEVMQGHAHPLDRKQQEQLKNGGQGFDSTNHEEKLHYTSLKDQNDEPVTSEPVSAPSQESEDTIEHLIVCLKGPTVVSALASLRHRLTSKSSILFIHNGMGVIDEVNEQIFPNPDTRPQYLLGILSHGLTRLEEYKVDHAGLGTLSLGPYPDLSLTNPSTAPLKEDDQSPLVVSPGSRYILRTLLRIPVLGAATFTPSALLCLQLDKLAVNSIINPLTALFDVRNGNLNYSFPVSRLQRLLLAETSLVLRSLPALKHLPGINTRFSPGRLETLCVSVAHKTGQNISSMLADMRAGFRTEIEYLNQWVVRRGEEMGIRCIVNYTIALAVRAKQGMIMWEKNEELPYVGNTGRPGWKHLQTGRPTSSVVDRTISEKAAERRKKSA
jgi:2-dehydropantoate 2-reductase